MGYAINFYQLAITFLNFAVPRREKTVLECQIEVITLLKSVPRYTEKLLYIFLIL